MMNHTVNTVMGSSITSSQSGLWVRDEGTYPQRWDNLGQRCSEGSVLSNTSAMDRTGYSTLPYLGSHILNWATFFLEWMSVDW